jgi:uncharacterized membrane protein
MNCKQYISKINGEIITTLLVDLNQLIRASTTTADGIIGKSSGNAYLTQLQTIVTGLIVSYLQGYVHQAMILGIGSGDPKSTTIGIGMWLGIIMAYNVWFVIWPNQKKALGIVDCSPEEKAKSAKTAMLFSRTNTLLSFPMLLSMVAAQNLY